MKNFEFRLYRTHVDIKSRIGFTVDHFTDYPVGIIATAYFNDSQTIWASANLRPGNSIYYAPYHGQALEVQRVK